MKNNKIIVFLIITFIISCLTISAKDDIKLNNLKIIIDHLDYENTIPVSSDVISLVLRLKEYSADDKIFHAYQIAAFDSEEIFDEIYTGMKSSDTKCFAPGTGMAAYSDRAIDTLYVHKYSEKEEFYGHHYIYYGKTEKDGRRSNLIKKEKDNVIVECPIDKIYYNNEDIDLNNIPIRTIYIIAFYDKNENEIIDEDELKKIIFIF